MEKFDDDASKNTSKAETINAQSLYTTLGLSSEDVDALAKIPESEISVETLPFLIMQLKSKRATETSSSTDTDYRDKSTVSEDKQKTPESCTGGAGKRKSPSKAPQKRSGSHEQKKKAESYKKTERYSGGRRDSKYSSSREKQSGDHAAVETECADNPTVFPHQCSRCKCVVNSIKVCWKNLTSA